MRMIWAQMCNPTRDIQARFIISICDIYPGYHSGYGYLLWYVMWDMGIYLGPPFEMLVWGVRPDSDVYLNLAHLRRMQPRVTNMNMNLRHPSGMPDPSGMSNPFGLSILTQNIPVRRPPAICLSVWDIPSGTLHILRSIRCSMDAHADQGVIPFQRFTQEPRFAFSPRYDKVSRLMSGEIHNEY